VADISKCQGTGCPLKEECYRYNAPSSDYWQAWFTEVPYNHVAGDCEQFWKMYDQRGKGGSNGGARPSV
jgi:hypothetical protein